MRTKLTITALAITGVVSVGALLPAFAQDGGSTESTEEPAEERPTIVEERRTAFAEALADELGIEEQRVADALEAVHERFREQREEAALARLEERLAEAVEAGELTQEQADAVLEAAEAGVLPLHRGRGHHGPSGGRFGGPFGGPFGGSGDGPFGGPGDGQEA